MEYITPSAQEAHWRSTVSKIKAIFKGNVTYAIAHSNIDNIAWLDELDIIGVDAYWPLTKSLTPNYGIF